MPELSPNEWSRLAIFLGAFVLGIFICFSMVKVFIKDPGNFPRSGLAFLLAGFVLIGFSIWQTISISIGADGDFEFAVEQTLGNAKAEANLVLREYDDRIKALEARLGASGQTASRDVPAEELANRGYTVLVFYRPDNAVVANDITQSLLNAGYASSRTQTSLGEARTQMPDNTAWIIWREHARPRLEDVAQLVNDFATGSDMQVVISPEPSKLKNGDIQVQLF